MTTRPPVHRSRIKKGVIAPLAVLATTLACVAVGLPAAQATDGPNAVFGKWEWSRFTDASTDPGQPADPDGQTGEENVANVIEIGERFEQQVPGTEHESSDWTRTLEGWVSWAPRTCCGPFRRRRRSSCSCSGRDDPRSKGRRLSRRRTPRARRRRGADDRPHRSWPGGAPHCDLQGRTGPACPGPVRPDGTPETRAGDLRGLRPDDGPLREQRGRDLQTCALTAAL